MNTTGHIKATIRDSEELLSYSSRNPFSGHVDTWGGSLLVEDGETVHSRHVYIIAGTTGQAYGGPEEGGWWYNHFHADFRVEAVVRSESELVRILTKTDELLTLIQGNQDTQIRIGGEDWPEFQRPHYE